MPPSAPQLWYFWRRRLFIWTSFVDSYFEILLYVAHSSAPSVAEPSRPAFRAQDLGPGSWGAGTSARADSDRGVGGCPVSVGQDHGNYIHRGLALHQWSLSSLQAVPRGGDGGYPRFTKAHRG